MNGLNLKALDPGLTAMEPLMARLASRGADAGKSAGGESLRKAAKDFESVLLHQLLEEMRKSIPESGLLEDEGNEQIQGMFWSYLAQGLSSAGGCNILSVN